MTSNLLLKIMLFTKITWEVVFDIEQNIEQNKSDYKLWKLMIYQSEQ